MSKIQKESPKGGRRPHLPRKTPAQPKEYRILRRTYGMYIGGALMAGVGALVVHELGAVGDLWRSYDVPVAVSCAVAGGVVVSSFLGAVQLIEAERNGTPLPLSLATARLMPLLGGVAGLLLATVFRAYPTADVAHLLQGSHLHMKNYNLVGMIGGISPSAVGRIAKNLGDRLLRQS